MDRSLGRFARNRARLLLEVVGRVRRAVGPDYSLSIKLNSSDFQVGGLTNEESAQIVTWLYDTGVDILELSGGSWEQPSLIGLNLQDQGVDAPKDSTRLREAYFLDTAARNRKVAKMPQMITGGFRSAEAMNAARASGELDAIGLARPLVAKPELTGALIDGRADRADGFIARLDPLHAMSW